VGAERGNHAVAALCRIIGASFSGFYAWLRAIPLRGHIGRIFAARHQVYGSPRIHAELRREGRRHSRRRVARLMRAMGLQARRGRRRTPRTTDSRHDLPIAPSRLIVISPTVSHPICHIPVVDSVVDRRLDDRAIPRETSWIGPA
jgi:putative transposase